MNNEINKISREEFFKLDEENLMFITNPGRMGDEDGSNFVVKNGDNYNFYRIDGWMYGDSSDSNYISTEEMFKVFPKWKEAWDNWNNSEYYGKYEYIYMGFGNGLCIDKRVYDEFYPYLIEEAKKNGNYNNETFEKNGPIFFGVWKTALENMINNKEK